MPVITRSAPTISGPSTEDPSAVAVSSTLEDHDRHRAVQQIMIFDQFDEGNDPHGEHDFGAIYRLVSGEWVQHRPQDDTQIEEAVFWKIDCYDKDLEFGSQAPWDSAQTTRVLSIMLASEY